MFSSPSRSGYYTPHDCPFCCGRKLLEQAFECVESIPIIHEDDRYDDAVAYALSVIDYTVSMWRCSHQETN